MKNKTSLLLMEQLVMILVFSLAAALCLQTFAKAERISQESIHRDRAVRVAQNAAELLKATDGDTQAVENRNWDGYRVAVTRQQSDLPGLARAEIQVSYEETLLFSLETGWQEVLP